MLLLFDFCESPVTDKKILTVANPLPIKHARFTEAPSFSTSVHHHSSISSSTTHQRVHQHLQKEAQL